MDVGGRGETGDQTNWIIHILEGEALNNGEGQGSLVGYSSWGREDLDMTWQLNSNESAQKHQGIF